ENKASLHAFLHRSFERAVRRRGRIIERRRRLREAPASGSRRREARARRIRDVKAENATPRTLCHEDTKTTKRFHEEAPPRECLHRIHRRVDASWRACLRAFVHAFV